jgi:hypothetical protein
VPDVQGTAGAGTQFAARRDVLDLYACVVQAGSATVKQETKDWLLGWGVILAVALLWAFMAITWYSTR